MLSTRRIVLVLRQSRNESVCPVTTTCWNEKMRTLLFGLTQNVTHSQFGQRWHLADRREENVLTGDRSDTFSSSQRMYTNQPTKVSS